MPRFDLTTTVPGLLALAILVIAYALVVVENRIHLRKSKPVIVAAGLMWILVAVAYFSHPRSGELPRGHLEQRVFHHLADFAALFLFLLVAMTYISAIASHNVFDWLRAWLVRRGFDLRAVYWATGTIAFLMSPVADNMTTALLMGSVAIAVGREHPKFLAASCASIVVAANASGAFSPFGDVTTLMVWTEGKVPTSSFFQLVVPSIANWLVPAFLMSFVVPKVKPEVRGETAQLRHGWWVVIVLFIVTIATAVLFHAVLGLPPFLGMTTGLGFYFLYGWHRTHTHLRKGEGDPLDVFRNVADVEWDTMLFFFGIVLCVGALQELLFLEKVGTWLYGPDGPGATWANVGIGAMSAIVDNVPLMFAVLNMNPRMDPAAAVDAQTPEAIYQWLLVTLTCGVGGSMLSIGSAAGVALMGAARGVYTFGSHLRFMPVIALGYAASIAVHWLMNAP